MFIILFSYNEVCLIIIGYWTDVDLDVSKSISNIKNWRKKDEL